MLIPKVLVIAGSDSSGGAGLEADQRTLAAHGCYAMTATTALTAQNTLGVEDVHVTSPAFVGKQIRKVMEDGFMDGVPGVVKIGMLASAETISVVASTLRGWQDRTGKELTIVLDPVMVATSGAQLLQGDAVRNLRELLLPMTTVLTPNLPEATLLLRDADIQYHTPSNLEHLKSLAIALHSLGPKHILLKGGHIPLTKTYTKAQTDEEKSLTVDILYPSNPSPNSPPQDSDFTIIESPYLSIPNTHGTGCSLASALAANLAHSSLSHSTSNSKPPNPLPSCTRNATTYISNSILSSPNLQSTLKSRGHGPINHLHALLPTPFPIGHFLSYVLHHPSILSSWKSYTNHPFTSLLSTGSLPNEVFKSYCIQDFHFLRTFMRAYSLAGFKSTDPTQISTSASIVKSLEEEMNMHVQYCEEEFHLSRKDLEEAPVRLATTAYSTWVLDVGARGDVLDLWVAMAPCLIGYEDVGRRIQGEWDEEDRKGESREEEDEDEDEDEEKRREQDELKKQTDNHENHPYPKTRKYARWVSQYTSPPYLSSVSEHRALIENEILRQGGLGRVKTEDLVGIFRRAAEFEILFWDGFV